MKATAVGLACIALLLAPSVLTPPVVQAPCVDCFTNVTPFTSHRWGYGTFGRQIVKVSVQTTGMSSAEIAAVNGGNGAMDMWNTTTSGSNAIPYEVEPGIGISADTTDFVIVKGTAIGGCGSIDFSSFPYVITLSATTLRVSHF